MAILPNLEEKSITKKKRCEEDDHEIKHKNKNIHGNLKCTL
jgi:hypothetical protein